VRNIPDVSVTFSNVRWGDIGSTFNTSGQVVESKALSAESGASVFGVASGTVMGLALLLGALLW
jgi:cellulase